MLSRNTYIEAYRIQLDEMNTALSELVESIHIPGAIAHNKYQIELRKLYRKSRLAAEHFEELRNSREETWESFVNESERVRDAFAVSFDEFKLQFLPAPTATRRMQMAEATST